MRESPRWQSRLVLWPESPTARVRLTRSPFAPFAQADPFAVRCVRLTRSLPTARVRLIRSPRSPRSSRLSPSRDTSGRPLSLALSGHIRTSPFTGHIRTSPFRDTSGRPLSLSETDQDVPSPNLTSTPHAVRPGALAPPEWRRVSWASLCLGNAARERPSTRPRPLLSSGHVLISLLESMVCKIEAATCSGLTPFGWPKGDVTSFPGRPFLSQRSMPAGKQLTHWEESGLPGKRPAPTSSRRVPCAPGARPRSCRKSRADRGATEP